MTEYLWESFRRKMSQNNIFQDNISEKVLKTLKVTVPAFRDTPYTGSFPGHIQRTIMTAAALKDLSVKQLN